MSTIPFSPKQKPDESTLTDRQRKVLDAIRTHIDEQGFAPSFREIGNAAGLKSPSSVKHQLQVLEDKGFIRMNANKGRAIEVVAGSAPNAEKPSQASEEATSTSNVAEIYQFPAEAIAESHDVPLVGRIAAGVPITAEQHVDDVMRLPERLTGSGTLADVSLGRLCVIPLCFLVTFLCIVAAYWAGYSGKSTTDMQYES